MSWFSFGSNDNKDSIKDKIRDLERDLRSIQYDYYKACDELDRAEREGDSISERRWDDYAYNLKCKKEDLEYEIRDLERSLQEGFYAQLYIRNYRFYWRFYSEFY